MKTYYVSLEELAQILNISSRTVQRLIEKELLPKPISKGKYDLLASFKDYIEHFDNANNDIDIKREKVKLIRAQATKAQLEVEQLEGKLIEVAEAKSSWDDLVLHCRAKLLAMPTKLARAIVALNNDIIAVEELLEKEIHAALTELSKYDGKKYDAKKYDAKKYDDKKAEEDI